MSIKEKVFLVLAIPAVCMLVFKSFTRSEVPAQECYPPDTTGVESGVFVWEGVSEAITDEGGGALDVSQLDFSGDVPVNTDTDVNDLSRGIWVSGQIEGFDMAPIIHGFLEIYKEYEKQCWNDSTFVDGITSVFTGDSLWVSNTWVHRDPTGKGFVKYLRDK